MIKVRHKGSFNHIERFFNKYKDIRVEGILRKVGEEGVEALSIATPKDTGKTAASWYYELEEEGGRYKVIWKNSNIHRGINIALIIQTGHGTRNGGYVEGVDYINPALRSIFENMAEEVWREVVKL